MKKLFISQPMNGKTEEEIMATRARAVEAAKRYVGEDVEVIASYFHELKSEAENRPLYLLGKSLELLATADVAYFAPGWESARGCRIENLCATHYGIETVIEDYK